MEAAQAPILLPGPAPCPPHCSSLGSLVPPGVLLSSSGWLCACHGWAPFQRTAVPSLLRDRAGEAFMTAPEERRAPLRPRANAIPHGGRCCVSQGCTGRCVGRVVLPDAIWASREGGGPGAGPVSSSPLGLSALPGGLEQLWELGPVCPESRAAGLVSGAHSSRNLLRVQGCCRERWCPILDAPNSGAPAPSFLPLPVGHVTPEGLHHFRVLVPVPGADLCTPAPLGGGPLG